MTVDVENAAYEWEDDTHPVHGHSYLVPRLLAILAARVSPGAHIIDVGCGNGRVASLLAARGYRVSGFDVSVGAIDRARAAFRGQRFEVASVYGDWATQFGPADCIVSLEVVEHLFYPKRLFEQSYAALRPGGRLIVSTPYHGYLKNLVISLLNGWDRHCDVAWDGGHIKFFSTRTLRAMAEAAGFHGLAVHRVGRFAALAKSMMLVAQK